MIGSTTKWIVTAVVLSWWFFNPSTVLAHATPTLYYPTEQAVLEASPKYVSISYSERVEENVSLIRVFDGDGQRVDLADSTVSTDNPREFKVSVPDELESGVYTVAWQLVSADDGHFSKGAFLFSIGSASEAQLQDVAGIQIQHVTSLPEIITIFIELVGQTLVVTAVGWWFVWRTKKADALIEPTILRLALVGSVLILVATAGHFGLKVLDLQQLILLPLKQAAIDYAGTVVGGFTLARFGLVVVSFGLLLTRKRFWLTLLALSILAQLFIRARVSHAAASLFAPEFSVFITWLHLIAKELWIGSALLMAALSLKSLPLKKWLALIQQWHWYLLSFLVVGGVTGVYIVWLDLKSIDNLTTEWGARMQVLTVLAAWMAAWRVASVGYAYLTKWQLHQWLGRALLLTEAITGLLVLGITSSLIITTPPLTLEKYKYQQTAEIDQHAMHIEPDPFNDSQLLLTVEDSSGQPISLSKMEAQLTSQEHGIGPLLVDPQFLSPGVYGLNTEYLKPNGRWDILVNATSIDQTELSHTFKMQYPNDIENTKVLAGKRRFNLLSQVSLALLLSLLLFIPFGTW